MLCMSAGFNRLPQGDNPMKAFTIDTDNSIKAEAAPAGPRDSSKAAQLIEMLKQPGGATLNDICLKFGWLPHTTRAMMSAGGSLRKKYGLVVISEKGADDRVYSIGA
jgi:hypothetical protein